MTVPTIGREDLRFRILKELGEDHISSHKAKVTVEALLEVLKFAVLQNERIVFKNIGVLQPHFKKARPGRNPKTGVAAVVKARVSYTFNMKSMAGCPQNKISTRDMVDRLLVLSHHMLTYRQATKVIHIFLRELAAVRDGKQRIELRGFGVFSPRKLESVKGRNPNTGELIMTKPQKSIHFKLGNSLKSSLVN